MLSLILQAQVLQLLEPVSVSVVLVEALWTLLPVSPKQQVLSVQT